MFDQIVNLDILNKEWAWVEEDFNFLNVSQGFVKLSTFFGALSEHTYDNLRRKLSYARDLTTSYQDIWDYRQLYR